MPRKQSGQLPANKPHFTFVKGLITEGSHVNFPEDAAREIVNVDIDINGFVKRRLGLQMQEDVWTPPTP